MRWQQKINFDEMIHFPSAATPNSKICFKGGGGGGAAARPAKFCWPTVAAHGLAPGGALTHEQLLGPGGDTERCNDGSKSQCSSSSSRTRVASCGFMVRNATTTILIKIAFLDIILATKILGFLVCLFFS